VRERDRESLCVSVCVYVCVCMCVCVCVCVHIVRLNDNAPQGLEFRVSV
jgi:hypothetical protein